MGRVKITSDFIPGATLSRTLEPVTRRTSPGLPARLELMKRLRLAKECVCGMRAFISTKPVRMASQLASTVNIGAMQISHKYNSQVGISENFRQVLVSGYISTVNNSAVDTVFSVPATTVPGLPADPCTSSFLLERATSSPTRTSKVRLAGSVC